MIRAIQCAFCGVVLVVAWRGRPRRFCSDRCRQAAYRRRRPRSAAFRWADGNQVEFYRERYGPDYYAQIGREGARVLMERRGREYYVQLGRKNGEKVKRERGSAWFAKLGRLGRPELKNWRASKRNRGLGKKGTDE